MTDATGSEVTWLCAESFRDWDTEGYRTNKSQRVLEEASVGGGMGTMTPSVASSRCLLNACPRDRDGRREEESEAGN